jgi:hypothetical protein
MIIKIDKKFQTKTLTFKCRKCGCTITIETDIKENFKNKKREQQKIIDKEKADWL